MEAQKIAIKKRPGPQELLFADTSFSPLFRELFDKIANDKNISDVHIEPRKNGVLIRIRRNGLLYDFKTIPKQATNLFFIEVKKIFDLQLGISDLAQDSSVTFEKYNLDIRVSSLPHIHGEKIVLRMLRQETLFDIATLGFSEEAIESIKEALLFKNGIIIFSGPTGSGKTSTLYSLLNMLDKEHLNIHTIEDPVEYTIPQINQIQISDKVTFANVMRNILRQDPDVILIGEIRDRETAELAFHAATTGHLVLTTIHTNYASDVVSKLVDYFKLDRDLVEQNLRLASSQRLIRRLCVRCASIAKGHDYSGLRYQCRDKNIQDITFKTQNHEGCPDCQYGVTGRFPIFEYLTGHHITNPGLPKGVNNHLHRQLLNNVASGKVCVTEMTDHV